MSAGHRLKCLDCGDVIQSKHRHDFVSCSCRKVSIDGGGEYQRMLLMPGGSYVDLDQPPDEPS